MVNGLEKEQKVQSENMDVEQSGNEEAKADVNETAAPSGTTEEEGLATDGNYYL